MEITLQNQSKDNALTVSQLTNLIKEMLEGSFKTIILKGEISNFSPSSAGHLYFVLKDSQAQISAVMFRGAASSLNFAPKDGMLVQVTGKISVYAPRGNYQLMVTSMTKAGSGNIMEMLEERKKKLYAEGLFDQSKKKPLPFFPKTVGVVTSPSGAALRDILNIRKRRNDKVNVVILPAVVQGESAAPTIVNMIETANKYKMCDVLIVGRGGGSLEDLLPFSEESVVRAVAASTIPVISAVGHEIDWSLCDFAADRRAPTPSAAAEIAIPEKSRIEQYIQDMKNNLYQQAENKLNHAKTLLKTFDIENMKIQFQNIEQRVSERYDRALMDLELGMKDIITGRRNRIALCTQALENCNPQNIFDRGYSMVCDAQTGKVIHDASIVKEGTKLTITPARGKIMATVDKIK